MNLLFVVCCCVSDFFVCLFVCGLMQRETPVRVSVLNLVDLAGSENAKMAETQGQRQQEARFINQSLLTLSTSPCCYLLYL